MLFVLKTRYIAHSMRSNVIKSAASLFSFLLIVVTGGYFCAFLQAQCAVAVRTRQLHLFVRIAMTKARILIVDDEAEAGEILCLRLERRGAACSYVTSGQAALDRLKDAPADVVLLDIKMPGMDGLEALRCIREAYPDTSVIIISGHADMGDAAKGMELGAFFYMLKPVNIDDLANKIEDALRLRELTLQ